MTIPEDIYPMSVFFTLVVTNEQNSTDWYNKTLGFRTIFSVHDPATKALNFVHLRRKKYQDILLVKGDSNKEKNPYGISISFQAWCDVDLLTSAAKENGACIVTEPHDTPWNTRDVMFQDLDGYKINFTYPSKGMIQELVSTSPDLLDSKSWEK